MTYFIASHPTSKGCWLLSETYADHINKHGRVTVWDPITGANHFIKACNIAIVDSSIYNDGWAYCRYAPQVRISTIGLNLSHITKHTHPEAFL